MTAGNYQTHKWRFQFLIFNIVSTDMSLNVMHTHQWQFFCIADCFCLCNAYQKRAYQSRTIGYRYCRNIIQFHICLSKCLFNDLIDLFNMFSGCDFRNDSTIQCMKCDLRRDHVGKHFSSVFYDRCCCLIAGTLDSKDQNVFFPGHFFLFFHLFLFLYPFLHHF